MPSSHSARSRTSAFTLPQNDLQDEDPVPPAESYEEFPNQTHSPSLPWLIEYWSSSFFQAPLMMMDQLCSCSSPASALDESYRVVHTNTYFEDAIQRSNAMVDTYPAKISQSRWDALRKVVASHDDTKDILDQSCNDNEYGPNSLYPTKLKTKRTNKQSSQSSIVCLNEHNDDDDVPIDLTFSMGLESPLRSGRSVAIGTPCSTYSLEASPSFEQYMDNTTSCEGDSTAFHTPPPSSRIAAIPQAPFLNRRRTRQQASALFTPYRLSTRLPPSPDPSNADTYTTISLSQSFAREFESDDSFEQPGDVFQTLATYPNQKNSPFRRKTTSKKASGGEEETKEGDEENKGTSSIAPQDEECMFLIRMSPTNYKHSYGLRDDKENSEDDIWSNASSSVLLPLHSHQRINFW